MIELSFLALAVWAFGGCLICFGHIPAEDLGFLPGSPFRDPEEWRDLPKAGPVGLVR